MRAAHRWVGYQGKMFRLVIDKDGNVQVRERNKHTWTTLIVEMSLKLKEGSLRL